MAEVAIRKEAPMSDDDLRMQEVENLSYDK